MYKYSTRNQNKTCKRHYLQTDSLVASNVEMIFVNLMIVINNRPGRC